MVKKQTISDLIKIQEIRNWSKGDIITITAPTGSGKSHFIKNSVYLVAAERKQKILFLVHRKRCKQQFFKELKKDYKLGIINITTYQSLEKNENFDFSEYEFIVCDEFHYFTSDSEFNYKTDISLEKILRQTDKIRIFMSATPKLINSYIKHRKIETKDYEIEKDFTWMNLNFFNKKADSVKTIIDDVLDKNEKALIFIDDLSRCYDLYRDYKDYSLFCCSENKSHYKYVDEEAIEKMLETEKFDKNLLITTNVLDAGVNIRDNKIKTIICSIRDIGVFILLS
ncbi:DEAD/DEAH box helicase family protein, partial [Clostridium perfringens]|uniref:DEAD/DEAH box helicase family protein n=1 Tax=Clostridium perfringens TaxID=1502 RepID=UPI0013E3D648